MDLADLIEAHLDGQHADVPEALRAEFDRAVAAHAAIRDALDETILVDGLPAVPDRRPPQLPDDYEIVRELGHGGMGVVYLARQKSLGRLVAVKVLRPGEQVFGPIVRRFEEEARHLARLRHPNVVAVHEVGRADGEPYFTVDYIEGEPLTARLAHGALTPSQALAILKPAAEGVRHAHEQGIIHRDLKPGNVLLDRSGRAYVTDFGLARDLGQSSSLTRSGEIMGTPAYMAPEQALGLADQIGEAADIHALGAILYEMLAGQPPYGQDAPARVLARLLDSEPVPPRRIDRRIPRDLETIVLTALAKEPARRYATIGALLEDLRRFEAGETPLARRPGFSYRSWRWVRRHGWGITAALLVAGVAVVIGTLIVQERTIASLTAEAEAHHTSGDHALAVRLYTTAARRVDSARRGAILGKITRCVAEIDDPKTALEVVLPVIDLEPCLSFGPLDSTLARAVMDGTRRATFMFRPEDRSKVELAAARLELVANGPFPADERQEARRLLISARALLGGKESSSTTVTMPPKEVEMPQGPASVEDLYRRSLDASIPPWERGKAAFDAGRSRAGSGDRDGALDAYRRAFELVRSVFPFYAGIDPKAQPDSKPLVGLLVDIDAAIHQLDPSAPGVLRGGLRFHVDGLEFPSEVDLEFNPRITAAEVDPKLFIPFRPSVVSRGGRPVWVGVADGRYRLTIPNPVTIFRPSFPRDDSKQRFFSLLEIDYSALPAEVEVRGKTIDLPPARARLLKEIKLMSPADRAAFDLTEGFFRWAPIPGAAKYRLELGVVKVNEFNDESHQCFGAFETEAPIVCLGVAADQHGLLNKLASEFRPGSLGEWHVFAIDATGRSIGAVVGGYRTFVVARGLERRK
jgi:serine/threonine-protein kinase